MMTVSIPVTPLAHAYIRMCMPHENGKPVLRDNHPLGKVALRLMSGKGVLARTPVRTEYDMCAEFLLCDEDWRRGRAVMTRTAVREFNALARTLIYEQLFMFVMVQWSVDPRYNIRKGMVQWCEAMGIGETHLSLDTAMRNFLNWRKRNFPEAMRSRGRYHNSVVNFSYKNSSC
jgi:hypothetical protein